MRADVLFSRVIILLGTFSKIFNIFSRSANIPHPLCVYRVDADKGGKVR